MQKAKEISTIKTMVKVLKIMETTKNILCSFEEKDKTTSRYQQDPKWKWKISVDKKGISPDMEKSVWKTTVFRRNTTGREDEVNVSTNNNTGYARLSLWDHEVLRKSW